MGERKEREEKARKKKNEEEEQKAIDNEVDMVAFTGKCTQNGCKCNKYIEASKWYSPRRWKNGQCDNDKCVHHLTKHQDKINWADSNVNIRQSLRLLTKTQLLEIAESKDVDCKGKNTESSLITALFMAAKHDKNMRKYQNNPYIKKYHLQHGRYPDNERQIQSFSKNRKDLDTLSYTKAKQIWDIKNK